MPDITMCKPLVCPKSENCYRHTAKPSEFLQSYFVDAPVDEKGNCKYFWPVEKEKKDS